MAAGDMAGLVRDHADDLVRIVGLGQKPAIDEHVVALRHEGVDLVAGDQMQLDGRGRNARRLEQWRGVDADGIFDFRVTQDVDLL